MLASIRAGLFILLLVTASVIDVRRHIVPYSLCLLILLVGLLRFDPAGLWGVLAALPLLAACVMTGGKGLGSGDVVLTAAVGAALGLSRTLIGLWLGLVALLLAYALRKAAYRSRGDALPPGPWPLVPFLSTGFIIAFFI